MIAQGSAVANAAYFTALEQRISVAKTAAELQTLATSSIGSINAVIAAINTQVGLLTPIEALLTPPGADLTEVVTWISNLASDFLSPQLVPLANYGSQLTAIATSAAAVVSAIEARAAQLGSSPSIPAIDTGATIPSETGGGSGSGGSGSGSGTGLTSDQQTELTNLSPLADVTPPAQLSPPTVTSLVTLDAIGNVICTLTATTVASPDANVGGYEFSLTVGSAAAVLYPTTGLSISWQVGLGLPFSVEVRAVKYSQTFGPWSTATTGTTATNPNAPNSPTGLTAIGGLGANFLSWTNPTNIDLDHIEVWASTADVQPNPSTQKSLMIGTVSAAPGLTGSYSQTGLTTNQTVYYWVRAVNTSGVPSPFNATGGVSATPVLINASIIASVNASAILAGALPAGVTIPSSGVAGTFTASQISSVYASVVSGQLAAINIPGIDASKIISGTLPSAVAVPAANLTGVIAASLVPQVNASAILAGALGSGVTIPAAGVNGTLTASQIGSVYASVVSGQLAAVNIPGIDASKIVSGQFSSSYLGAGSVLASKLASGTTSNLVADPSFLDAAYWGLSSTVLFGLTNSDAAFTQLGVPSSICFQAAGAAPSTGYVAQTEPIVVEPNKYYRLAGRFGINGAFNGICALQLYWYTAAGAYISSSVEYGTDYRGGASGAVTLSSLDGLYQAPPNAYFARYTAVIVWGASAPAGGVYFATPVMNRAIDSAFIVAGSVTANAIAAATITSAQIAAGTIVASNIAAGTITGTQIAANTITGANIVAGTISASNIAAGAITASKLVLTDTDNLITDPQLTDPSAWVTLYGTSADWYFAGVGDEAAFSAFWGSQHSIQIGAGLECYVGSNLIACNPTDTFYISAKEATATTGTGTAEIFVFWYDGSGTTALGLQQLAVYSLVSELNTYSAQVSTFSGAAFFRLVFVSRADNTVGPQFGGPIVRRAASAQLIVDGTITATQIAASTITGSNIAAGTITAGNLAANTITSGQIAAGTIVAYNIATGTITGSLIAGETITGANIVAGAISAAQIAAGTITGANIAALTITGSNIAAGTITASNLYAGTITSVQIAANTITGTNIAAGTITASNIQGGTITSSQIAAGSIVASSLSVSTLSAITANLGYVTAGYLYNSDNTNWLDLYNGRSQWQAPSSSYALRAGAIGSGVTLWYGLASVAVGSETRTNGVWAFGTDGQVYYGANSLAASVPQTHSAQNTNSSAPNGSTSTPVSTTFNSVVSGSIWQAANMSMRPHGVASPFSSGTTSASGTWTLIETGSTTTVTLASGTWTWSDFVTGEGIQSAVVNNPTSISGTPLSNTGTVTLELQLEATSGSLNANNCLTTSVFGQIVASS